MATSARRQIADRLFVVRPQTAQAYENAVRSVYGPYYETWPQAAARALLDVLRSFGAFYPDSGRLADCCRYTQTDVTHAEIERHLWCVEKHLWHRLGCFHDATLDDIAGTTSEELRTTKRRLPEGLL